MLFGDGELIWGVSETKSEEEESSISVGGGGEDGSFSGVGSLGGVDGFSV